MRGDPGNRRSSSFGAPRGLRTALFAEALSRAAARRDRRQDPRGNGCSLRAAQARRRVLLPRSDGVTGAALLQALRRGDRRALARAITLVESSRPDHRDEAERIIETLLPETGKAERIGISGPPGAGKSTFIERFGLAGIALGRRIAVLAVDPASKRGGGAILGDKTRMAELARAPEAFIRPSSAGDSRGGIARRTREAILLCEAAGFDAILVETIGVGQTETAAADT